MSMVPTNGMKKSWERLTRLYEDQLPSSPAEKYLIQRGITKEAQNYFHLGFVGEPEPEERPYLNRLSIPFIVGSTCVGIKYRVLDDREPKYLSSSGFEARRIFNPNILKSLHTKVYVCEGELDAITLTQLGVPAVAIPGANNWNPVAGRALRHRRIVVLADGDGKTAKGREAGPKLGKQLLSSLDDCGMIIMEGTDVNQYFLDHGGDQLLEYIGWSSE